MKPRKFLELEINAKEVPNARSYVSADVPALAMTRICPWNAEEHFYFEKKNTFTFTGTTEVRSTLQTLIGNLSVYSLI